MFQLRQNAIFDELRFHNNTQKKASLINLPLAFNYIKGHLYSCFFNIQEQNSIFTKTRSHANLCKFCWGIDGGVTFRQDNMLLSMRKHTWGMGAKQNAPHNATVKKWSRSHWVLQMQIIMRNLKRHFKK